MLSQNIINFNDPFLFRAQKNVNHIVDPSPWPIYTAFSVCQLLLSLLYYMDTGYSKIFFLSLLQLSYLLWQWFYNIIIEATFEGMHTKVIRQNIYLGMALFIVSEVMFFFSFFWAFFSFSLMPSVWIGCIWPPVGIKPINYLGLPLFNTILLLSSGVSITCAHRLLLAGKHYEFNLALIVTIFYGLIFLVVQYFEYNYAQFTISDSVYGSTFYLLTGFHGLHVFIGLVFLFVCLIRSFKHHFTKERHVGFECAAWYWHFVDVVWLFLYIFVYCWGSIPS